MASSQAPPSVVSDDQDLYDVLQIRRDAAAPDIKASYRRLSQLYHPDKHLDPDAKQTATDKFMCVKEAYEILSSEKLRRIYDEFGLHAAKSSSTPEMDLVPYADLAARFRADAFPGRYAGTAPNDLGRDAYFTVANSIEPRIDATGLLVALDDGIALKSFSDIDGLAVVTQVGVASLATAYVSQNDTVTARYAVSAHGAGRGMDHGGVGDLALSWRRQLDPHMHIETALNTTVDEFSNVTYSVKMFRSLTKWMSMAWEATYSTLRGDFTTSLSCARALDERSSASVSWATGSRSSYAFTWGRSAYDEFTREGGGSGDRDEFGGNVDEDEGFDPLWRDGVVPWALAKLYRLWVPVGVRWSARWSGEDASLSLVARRPVGEQAPLWSKCEPTGPGGPYVRLSGLLGLLGWEVKAGVGRRFMLSDAEVGTSLGVGTIGVVWRVKMRRGAHRLDVPIVLQSRYIDARTAALAGVALSVVVSLVEGCVIAPWRERLESGERREAKAKRRDVVEAAKKEAEEAVRLMAVRVETIRRAEGDVEMDGGVKGGGLLIERAVYGVRRFVRKLGVSDAVVTGKETEVEMVEVTVAVQVLVEGSALQIVASTKSTLAGFWDASAYGDKEELALKIWYRFRGLKHECLLRDDEPIELPLSSHRVYYWS